VPDEPERRLLDSRPIVDQINALRTQESRSILGLATESGVSARSIHRHLSGEAVQIRRGNAEAILAAVARLQQEGAT
jgi:hypothetical protein